jgi:hypothetical protein
VFVKSERATKTQDNNTIQSIGKISSALLILREVMVFLSDIKIIQFPGKKNSQGN